MKSLNLKTIEKKFIKALPHAQGDKYSRVSPALHWKMLFLSFIGLNVIIVLWSLYMFWGVRTGSFAESINSAFSGHAPIDEEQIDAVTSRYDALASKLQSLKNAAPTYVDPK